MISGLLDGLAQLFAPTHLLAMIAIGLLASQQVPNRPGLTVLAFAAGLLLGSILIALGLGETPGTVVLLSLAASAGLLVAFACPLPRLVRDAFAFAAGVALALNSPPQAITIARAVATQIGTDVAAVAALSVIAVIASKVWRGWQHIAVRVVGSWVAASAILILALRLAR
jgi:hydrogenase/urease accessory protein HupE